MSNADLLIEQLSHEDVRIRLSAVKALGKIGDKEAVVALKNVLQDESVAVVRTAVLAIGTIGGCDQTGNFNTFTGTS